MKVTSSDVRLIISKLKETNVVLKSKLSESKRNKYYFVERSEEKGNFNITDTLTANQLIEEIQNFIEGCEKEIEENNGLIERLKKELEEAK